MAEFGRIDVLDDQRDEYRFLARRTYLNDS